jgi:ATP/maltotriose-dependent transcriptional regulator MalT
MGLRLVPEDVATIQARTEGWIAGLQLAALSLQGHAADAPESLMAFKGSHRFVPDYLSEEVLARQTPEVQTLKGSACALLAKQIQEYWRNAGEETPCPSSRCRQPD